MDGRWRETLGWSLGWWSKEMALGPRQDPSLERGDRAEHGGRGGLALEPPPSRHGELDFGRGTWSLGTYSFLVCPMGMRMVLTSQVM